MLSDASPEVELLVYCIHPSGDIAERDSVRALLEADVDWDQVLELADRHGVTPLLNQAFASDGGELASMVPDSIRSRLSERARSTAMRNVQLATELQSVLDTFDDYGIRALPFKGPVLASYAYGDVGLREFADIDILVPREDVSAAVDVLESQGYTWQEVPRFDDAALLGGPFTKALVPEYELHRESVIVEVRWRVGDPDRPFSPDVETLWQRRDSVAVSGTDVPALSPEDRLLVLAFHGTKHRWYLLKWVCDFVAALERTDVDWLELLEQARRHELERKFLIGLALATGLFDVPIPDWVRDRLDADERATDLAAQVMADYASGVPTRPPRTERIAFNAKACDSTGDSLRTVLFHSRFHPGVTEYRLLPLPGPLHPLYYLVLPVRLLADRSPSLGRGT